MALDWRGFISIVQGHDFGLTKVEYFFLLIYQVSDGENGVSNRTEAARWWDAIEFRFIFFFGEQPSFYLFYQFEQFCRTAEYFSRHACRAQVDRYRRNVWAFVGIGPPRRRT